MVEGEGEMKMKVGTVGGPGEREQSIRMSNSGLDPVKKGEQTKISSLKPVRSCRYGDVFWLSLIVT